MILKMHLVNIMFINTLVNNMFADDTYIFYPHHNIKTISITANKDLNRIRQCFKANKLSLNIKKIF